MSLFGKFGIANTIGKHEWDTNSPRLLMTRICILLRNKWGYRPWETSSYRELACYNAPEEIPQGGHKEEMPRNVTLDDDVFAALQKKAVPLDDNINDVLRRELGLSTARSEPFVRIQQTVERREMKTRYRYSEGDDLVALYIYKYGDGDLPQSTDTLGNSLGMGSNSMRMRISNFRAIDTNGKEGLRNWARQSESIYRQHEDRPRDQLREKVIRYLSGRRA